MSITSRLITEYVDDHPIVGKRLVRVVELHGATNTQGDAEVYRARLDGFYSDGGLRFDALVQRTNGAFASLNNNVHRYRVAAVHQCLKVSGALDEYETANRDAT